MKLRVVNKKLQKHKDFQEVEWTIFFKQYHGLDSEWSEHNFIIEVENAGQMIGYLECFSEAGVMRVKDLIVKHDCKGKGIGKKIINKLEQESRKRKIHKIIIETGKNWDAEKFYQATNYQKVRVLPNHFLNDDYVEYVKFLD